MAKSAKEETRQQSTRSQKQESAPEKQSSAERQSEERSQEQGLERWTPSGAISPWTSWSGSPFSFMRRFSEEMDRLFGDFGFGRTPFSSLGFGGGLMPRGEFGRGVWVPQVEMFKRGDQFVVRADLPGLNKDDIKVEVADNCLMIQGERRQEHEETQEGRYHSERSYGRFYRCIELPPGVDEKDVTANFRDGVLEVTMPAPSDQESRGRRIEVK